VSGSSPRTRRQQQSEIDFGTPEEWREQVQERALPVLDHWNRGHTLDAVRNRLRGWLGASLLVIAIRLVFDPGGLTGTLLTLWFLPAALLGTVAGSLLVLFRNPTEASEIWFEQNLLATIGLIALAGLARGSRRHSAGLTAWRLLFGSDPPLDTAADDATETDIDQQEVARFQRYLRYAIAGSLLVIALEQLLLRDLPAISKPSGTVGLALSPVEWVLVLVGGVVLGAVIGALLAVTDV
jgi:small-conductance mechanosensitive channel